MGHTISKLRHDESRLIAGAAILGVALVGVGLLATPDGLVGNLISEAAGLAFGVVVAIVLIERVLQRQRAREWETVGQRTTRAIKRRIWNIAFAYHLSGGDTPLDEDSFADHMRLDRPEPEIAAAVTALSGAMRLAHPLGAAGSADPCDDSGEPPVTPNCPRSRFSPRT